MKAGTKVIALRNVTRTDVFSFGEGIYLGDEVPPEDSPEGSTRAMLRSLGMSNPKIQLNNGKIVWGCECWWGDAEETREQYKGCTWHEVDIDEERAAIQPEPDDEDLEWEEDEDDLNDEEEIEDEDDDY